MFVPDYALYSLLYQLLQTLFGHIHSASLQSVTQLVWALLASQSLHPADLVRALPGLETACARQAFRRVRRALLRSHIGSDYLTPLLVHAVLRLLPDREIMLILDSTRCRNWEIFTLSLLFQGRVLPVAWSVLPYPWPENGFTPCVIALINRTLRSWPVDRPVHLLGDRAFPSLKLFRTLDSWRKWLPLGYTIRLRAADYVRLENGRTVKVADLIALMAVGSWGFWRASYQRRKKAGPLALLVVGRGIPIYPDHQKGPSDQKRRADRAQRRIAHILSKGQDPSTDSAWALLSTASGCSQAVRNYRYRFSTEGTYRDLKEWGLEAVAARDTDKDHLDGLIGLAILAYVVQAAIGAAAGRADQGQARARQLQWCTTDRLSVFWRGRQVLQDRAHDWRLWLRATLPDIIHQLDPLPSSVRQLKETA